LTFLFSLLFEDGGRVVTGAYNAAVTNSGIAQNLNKYIYIFFFCGGLWCGAHKDLTTE